MGIALLVVISAKKWLFTSIFESGTMVFGRQDSDQNGDVMSIVVKVIIRPKESDDDESSVVVENDVWRVIEELNKKKWLEKYGKEYESELAAAFSNYPDAKLKKKPKKPPTVEPVKPKKS